MTLAVLVVDDSLTVRLDLSEAFEAAGLRAAATILVIDDDISFRETLAETRSFPSSP